MGGVGGVSKTLDTSIYRTRFGSQAALYCALPARVCASTALSQATVALAGGRGAGRSSIERRPFTHTGKTSSQPPHCDERTAVLRTSTHGLPHTHWQPPISSKQRTVKHAHALSRRHVEHCRYAYLDVYSYKDVRAVHAGRWASSRASKTRKSCRCCPKKSF